MKYNTMSIRSVLSIVVLIFLLNLSSQQNSTNGPLDKNKINIYGNIVFYHVDPTDLSHGEKEIAVENISIGKMYQNIPVYRKPLDADMRPDVNTAYIDLTEIATIVPLRINHKPSINKFAGREYLDIQVISNDAQRTEQSYIIERSRKIYCYQVNEAGPIKNELLFEGVKQLNIIGYKHREAQKEMQCVPESALTGTKKIIEELDSTSKQLETAESGQLEQLTSRLNHLIKQLRSSVYNLFGLNE